MPHFLNKPDVRNEEITPSDVSGGTNTSHTIIVPALTTLLSAESPNASVEDYERAVLKDNVLSKDTEGARRRTFRYLKELYFLRRTSILFRALRDLWSDDIEAQPLLAGSCALARDAVFRASSTAIFDSSPGDSLVAADLAAAVGDHFLDSYNEASLAKIGRNTFSSWEQTGHLAEGDGNSKTRTRALCRSANVAYACLLGHLEGYRGQMLFDTLWAHALDQPTSLLQDLAFGASQRGLMEYRHAGGVVEVSFHALLRPFEGELL